MATKPTPRQILDLQLPPNDSGATTVRGYLVELLRVLWREEEGFDGKRPFGNSGWSYDVYRPMIEAGFIAGTIDEDGYIDNADIRFADRLIDEAIQTLDGTEAP